MARPESRDFGAGAAWPSQPGPVCAVEVALTAGRAVCFGGEAVRRSGSAAGVGAACACASAGRLPVRGRRRLGSWRSSASRTSRPTSCPTVIARVHVRQQARKLLQAALTLRVDERLQLVAAVAERAHAIGRRRQFRVQIGQHPLDLPRALAGRLLDQLLPPDCIQHQRRRSATASRRATARASAGCRRTAAWQRCAARRPRRCSPVRARRTRTGWRTRGAGTGCGRRFRPDGR